MKHDNDDENCNDANHVGTASTTESLLTNAKPQFEIPSVVVDVENCDNLNGTESSFSANSSCNSSSSETVHSVDNSANHKNGTCSTNTTSTDDNGNENKRPHAKENDLLDPSDNSRLIRSTSLHSTIDKVPTQKKIVRFADVLGLDLADVRHFIKDKTPIVPQSAFADLHVSSCEKNPFKPLFNTDSELPKANRVFVPQFQQPGCDPQFMLKLREQKVCLENVLINGLRVTGVVRTLNIGFEKHVHVRYTSDEWLTHKDINAEYLPNSSDGFSDKFVFDITLPTASLNEKLIFVIKYVVNDEEHWDNNSGQNFTLKCEENKS